MECKVRSMEHEIRVERGASLRLFSYYLPSLVFCQIPLHAFLSHVGRTMEEIDHA
jgi:hypothetical protein